MENEYYPELNKRYREEGWGQITDKALHILPENVESQARTVARWAWDEIQKLTAKIEQLEDGDGSHHTPEIG